MKARTEVENKLTEMTQKGFLGFPVATVTYYGPDDSKATKVAVGIIRWEGAGAEMHRWFTEGADARLDEKITDEILELIRQEGAITVAAVGKILGCPHEEGIDYPAGQACPRCPYWAGKDRWEGVIAE
jgi:hypothetical protein